MEEGEQGLPPEGPGPDAVPTADAGSETGVEADFVGFGGGLDGAMALLEAGGPVVWVLLGMSVVATAVTLLKLWQFAWLGVGARRGARRALALYRQGNAGAALDLAGRSAGPLARTLALAMRGMRRGVTEAKVREEVLRQGGDVLETLRGGFRILEVIAALAPLLGLFGTVLGMIEAFRQLEAAGDRVSPSILSGGIWQALLTTAVGLGVAIPVVAVLNWLERRVERLAHAMDSLVTQVFTEDLSDTAGTSR